MIRVRVPRVIKVIISSEVGKLNIPGYDGLSRDLLNEVDCRSDLDTGGLGNRIPELVWVLCSVDPSLGRLPLRIGEMPKSLPQ
jgi:hypothetical protein